MACAIAGGCSHTTEGESRAAPAPVSWAGVWEYTAPPANSAGGSPISMQTVCNQNAGLDQNKDGTITVQEATAAVRRKFDKGVKPGFLG